MMNSPSTPRTLRPYPADARTWDHSNKLCFQGPGTRRLLATRGAVCQTRGVDTLVAGRMVDALVRRLAGERPSLFTSSHFRRVSRRVPPDPQPLGGAPHTGALLACDARCLF